MDEEPMEQHAPAAEGCGHVVQTAGVHAEPAAASTDVRAAVLPARSGHHPLAWEPEHERPCDPGLTPPTQVPGPQKEPGAQQPGCDTGTGCIKQQYQHQLHTSQQDQQNSCLGSARSRQHAPSIQPEQAPPGSANAAASELPPGAAGSAQPAASPHDSSQQGSAHTVHGELQGPATQGPSSLPQQMSLPQQRSSANGSGMEVVVAGGLEGPGSWEEKARAFEAALQMYKQKLSTLRSQVMPYLDDLKREKAAVLGLQKENHALKTQMQQDNQKVNQYQQQISQYQQQWVATLESSKAETARAKAEYQELQKNMSLVTIKLEQAQADMVLAKNDRDHFHTQARHASAQLQQALAALKAASNNPAGPTQGKPGSRFEEGCVGSAGAVHTNQPAASVSDHMNGSNVTAELDYLRSELHWHREEVSYLRQEVSRYRASGDKLREAAKRPRLQETSHVPSRV